jgi:N6-L-threonylcarbamoyladenine synthase
MRALRTRSLLSRTAPSGNPTTDNGAMIALAGHLRLIKGQVSKGNEIVVKPRWSLEQLQAV